MVANFTSFTSSSKRLSFVTNSSPYFFVHILFYSIHGPHFPCNIYNRVVYTFFFHHVCKKMESSCTLIVADFNDIVGCNKLRDIAHEKNCDIHVISKSSSCNDIQGVTSCRNAENKGREQHSYLSYIVENYDNLSGTLYFTPSNLANHNPADRVEKLFANDKAFDCGALPGPAWHESRDFEITDWAGHELKKCSVRPYSAWLDKIGIATESSDCLNGIFKTNANLLLNRPKTFYEDILAEYASMKEADTECSHYLERAAHSVYGKWH